MSMEDMLREGLLIGLLLALMGAVCIDWLFAPRLKVANLGEKLFFVVFPFTLISVLMVSSAILLMVTPDELNIPKIETCGKWVYVICISYCLIVKFFHFLPEESTHD